MRTHINEVPGKRIGNYKQTHSVIFDLSPGLTAGLLLWQQGKRAHKDDVITVRLFCERDGGLVWLCLLLVKG